MKKRTLITSALPYANGHLHLGHAAGAYLPADIFARFMRLSGEEILYVCGSDEHGVAITISAEKEKVTPQQIVDKYHFANKEAFDKFGMTFDIYSRTSEPLHHETAREFFADFLKKGYLTEKEEEQFFDKVAGIFLPDRYVEGVCPNCGYDKARGDQCDSCGAYYNQTELKSPISIVSGKTPEVRKTTHWYFAFDQFQTFLEGFLQSHEHEWKENVVAQTRSWLKVGMAERAITRDLDWGVKIEGIEGISDEKAFGKRLYVWFDAVLGYISATKIWANENKEDWTKWWKNPDTDYIAFIGKDNIVFHTLIFPAYLHGYGDYILPHNVPANEFLNLEGQKFSKSRNWSIDLHDFLADFPSPIHVDVLRYSLAMNFPETRDSDFTWKDFQTRNNSELASIFGNFVNRTLQFLHKNYEGNVPELSGKYADLAQDWQTWAESDNADADAYELFVSKYSENDANAVRSLIEGIAKSDKNFRKYRFRDGITDIMNVARAANKYFNDEEPWKSGKSDPEKCAKTLFVCCQFVRTLGVLFAPITPNTSATILNLLSQNNYTGQSQNANPIAANLWKEASYPTLKSGSPIHKPEILFTHIENDVVEAQMAKLGDKEAKNSQPEQELIDIDYFSKVKLVTAKIISAEKLPKSKKLLKLQIDTGAEKRQILAGVAEFYEPDYLIGKIIVVVANLKPAKLMGEMSEGMMLAASKDGKLLFVTPEKEIGEGAEVR
jgi:methionyl-tRNA synthetase